MNEQIANIYALLGPATRPEEAWRVYKQRYATSLSFPQFMGEWQRVGKAGQQTPADILSAGMTANAGQAETLKSATTGPLTAVSNSNAYPNTAPALTPEQQALKKQAEGLPTTPGMTVQQWLESMKGLQRQWSPAAQGLQEGVPSIERGQGQAPAGEAYGAVPPQRGRIAAKTALDMTQLAQPLTEAGGVVPDLTQQILQYLQAPRPGVALTDEAAQRAREAMNAPEGWTEKERAAMYQRATEPFLDQYNQLLKQLELQSEMRGQFYGGALPTAQGTALTDLAKILSGTATDIEVQNALNRENVRQQRLQQTLDVAAQQYGFGSEEYQQLSNMLANQQSYQMGLEQQALERARGLGALRLEEWQQMGYEGVPGSMELAYRAADFTEYLATADLEKEQDRIEISRRALDIEERFGTQDRELARDAHRLAVDVADWDRLDVEAKQALNVRIQDFAEKYGIEQLGLEKRRVEIDERLASFSEYLETANLENERERIEISRKALEVEERFGTEDRELAQKSHDLAVDIAKWDQLNETERQALNARIQDFQEQYSRTQLVYEARRIGIDERLAKYTILSGEEKDTLARDIFEDQSDRWKKELEEGRTEAEAQRAFEEKIWDKQEDLTRKGWVFQANERIGSQNFQMILERRADALTQAGWTHETAIMQATQEWQTGERRETERWVSIQQMRADNLVRLGWEKEDARALAQREHDTFLLGRQQSFEQMERIGSQNFQQLMTTTQNALIERGWAREDVQAEANRVMTRQLAYMDAKERRDQFNATLEWDKARFLKEYGFNVDQFKEMQSQYDLGRYDRRVEFAQTYRLDERQLGMAEAQFEQTHALEVDRLAKQYDIETTRLDESVREYNLGRYDRVTEFARQYGLEVNQFEEAQRQFNVSHGLEVDRLAKQYGLEERRLNESIREYNLDRYDRVIELARQYKLDVDRLEEGIRQFDTTEERLQSQFLAQIEREDARLAEAIREYNLGRYDRVTEFARTFGLETRQFDELTRQYDLGREDRLQQWTDENDLDWARIREATRQFNIGDFRAMQQLAEAKRIDTRNFTQAQTEYTEGREDRLAKVAWENGFAEEQFKQAIREFNINDFRAMQQLAAAREIDERDYVRATYESDRNFNENQRQFDRGIEDGMTRARMYAGFEFIGSGAMGELVGELPEDWDTYTEAQKDAWFEDHPIVMRVADFLANFLEETIGLDLNPDDIVDGAAEYVQTLTNEPVDVSKTKTPEEILTPNRPAPNLRISPKVVEPIEPAIPMAPTLVQRREELERQQEVLKQQFAKKPEETLSEWLERVKELNRQWISLEKQK